MPRPAGHVAYARQMIESLPLSIRHAMEQPDQARSLIYALLVVDEAQPLHALQQVIVNETPELIELSAAHVATLKSAGRAAWLPILEMVIPTLDENDGPAVALLLSIIGPDLHPLPAAHCESPGYKSWRGSPWTSYRRRRSGSLSYMSNTVGAPLRAS